LLLCLSECGRPKDNILLSQLAFDNPFKCGLSLSLEKGLPQLRLVGG